MKVYLDSIGCRLNQAEIEQMARQFRAEGHSLVAQAAEADLVVINTCAVTSEAAADSRQKIRQAARAGAGQVVVTGCWSTLAPQAAAELPQVMRVIPNQRKDALVAETLGKDSALFDREPLEREALPGMRHRTRAFIKVQDGCDNACTFCVTTLARGEGRSRPLAEVLSDIQAALAGGAQEIVLTGVHLGSWGQETGQHLRHLVSAILQQTETPRLRLSSLEPWDLDEEFFALWENPRLMPHLHLPLQAGCDATLKRMRRKTTTAAFRALAAAARRHIPQVALATDLIAGFPGETEQEFSETLAFVQEMDFAAAHVFTYSPRPGTPAARMKDHLPAALKKERSARLREITAQSACDYRQRFIGQTLPVLWESVSGQEQNGWRMEGLTGNYLRVQALCPEPRWNQIDPTRLLTVQGETLIGHILKA